ncbi:uncharacterized protein N7515_003948 [Penicillium bovifimosum]|uniref:Uncharacterized protein n=1 Tax=Penicillium bovifimosum TaxID=126998 RepID=A0A9W9H5L0_9EURO|nr:uncharacterized protein N7515_003948 [Penicillium bovifimosum]KAJ5139100.1 hypothetical protein N7515_003948 [Penicillium bovifimosum]
MERRSCRSTETLTTINKRLVADGDDGDDAATSDIIDSTLSDVKSTLSAMLDDAVDDLRRLSATNKGSTGIGNAYQWLLETD